MRMWLVMSAALVLGALCACGGEDGAEAGSGDAEGGAGTTTTTGTGATTGAGAGGSTGSGPPPGEWQTLIEGEWSVAPGSESYTCVVATVERDMYISAFRPISPLGTHHTVLTRAVGGNDGTYPCDAATNGQNMIFGSGVGTETLQLPEGVAVRLSQGERLLLNLHLFNTDTAVLTGLSGTEVLLIDPSEVVEESRVVLAGTQDINIPAQSTKTESGSCSIDRDVTIWAVAPHMHQYGTHMTITAMESGAPNVLHDDAYDFDGQLAYVLDTPLSLSQGDRVDVDCTFNNTSTSTVGFGDSSNAEMCFGGLFYYPADAINKFICDN